MEKKTEEQVRKRMKEGWIKTSMMVEAMAISKDAVESALKKHVERMEKEKCLLVYRKEFQETSEVEKPLPNIPKGFSQVVEIEALAENFDRLVYVVLNYAPSSIEILEPKRVDIDIGQAQGILNTIAIMIHRFAASGGGGMIVST
jgi:ribosome-interacting GTPase 1